MPIRVVASSQPIHHPYDHGIFTVAVAHSKQQHPCARLRRAQQTCRLTRDGAVDQNSNASCLVR